MKKLPIPLLALGLAVGLFLGMGPQAVAQQAIRLFGTTSTGASRAVLVNSSGAMVVAAGASAGQFPILLTSNATQTCTDANLTEKDLWTYSLPAGTLGTDLQGLRVTTWGTFGATANTKNVRSYFGATVPGLYTTTANGLAWRSSYMLMRTAAATQIAFADAAVDLGGANTIIRITTPAETLSGAVTIKLTGQNGTAAANDVCFRGAMVERLR